MILGNAPLGFTGTAAVSGSGWFDRNGIERPKHGEHNGKPYSMVTPPCTRCGGQGGSDAWKHTGWKCFKCGGSCKGETRRMFLYTPEVLKVLNVRRDAQRAKKAAAYAVIAAELEAAHEVARAARKAILEADPFYIEFQALMGTLNIVNSDGQGEHDATRRDAPPFLVDMWKRIQHMDLSEKQTAAVQKFLDSVKGKESQIANSRHIAEVGTRIALTAKVVFVREIFPKADSAPAFDRKFLIKMVTGDGQSLVWFTSRAFENGVTLIGKATVKAHKEYQGVKETQVTNFRIKDETTTPDKELV